MLIPNGFGKTVVGFLLCLIPDLIAQTIKNDQSMFLYGESFTFTSVFSNAGTAIVFLIRFVIPMAVLTIDFVLFLRNRIGRRNRFPLEKTRLGLNAGLFVIGVVFSMISLILIGLILTGQASGVTPLYFVSVFATVLIYAGFIVGSIDGIGFDRSL